MQGLNKGQLVNSGSFWAEVINHWHKTGVINKSVSVLHMAYKSNYPSDKGISIRSQRDCMSDEQLSDQKIPLKM